MSNTVFELDRLTLTAERLQQAVDWSRHFGDEEMPTAVVRKRLRLFKHADRIQITEVRLVE